MQIEKNFELTTLNTFGVESQAQFFVRVGSKDDFLNLASQPSLANINKLCLGSGSNILFTQDFQGLIIKNEIKGIQKIHENENELLLQVGAGENWSKLVEFCVQNNWCGIENLILIPGTVGAAPIQNIGAYGVEISNLIESVEYFDWSTKQFNVLNANECQFSYRDSIFKQKGRGQWFVTGVQLRLLKHPQIKRSYAALETELKRLNLLQPNIQDMARVIAEIRRTKLPNPEILGNAGSFFKNPVITRHQFEKLKEKFPNVVSYDAGEGLVKIAAGWLIEKSGWKGKRFNSCGVHQDQALVLVNYGGAKGSDILELSKKIQVDIYQRFQISLEPEVLIL